MKLFLSIFSNIVALLLIITVLVQQRGVGLGRTFGGESAVYRTRRGAERFLFWLTIILGIIYVVSALAGIILLKG